MRGFLEGRMYHSLTGFSFISLKMAKPSKKRYFEVKLREWGTLAEGLRSGLQNRLRQFNSGRCLHAIRAGGGKVYTRDLKSLARIGLAGSSPALRTKH